MVVAVMSQLLQFKCARCNHRLEIPPEDVGKPIHCPACEYTPRVPVWFEIDDDDWTVPVGVTPTETPAPDLPTLVEEPAVPRTVRPAWPWATLVLALLTVGLFAAMALAQKRVLEFNAHVLMTWGADDAPRTFGGQWWRLFTALFLHSGLAHLLGNLLFLLLMAPHVERLLGPLRFILVYLFAGLGGAVAGMAWFPTGVSVGASGAVFGVYGALLGCCVRRPGTVPRQVMRWQGLLLVLYTGFSLLHE
jgi:membrane associated rhomboid family serine protease